MKIISWNCRGLGKPKAYSALKKLMNLQKPDMVFLCETKMLVSEMSEKCKKMGFPNHEIVGCTGEGRSGGLALFWNKEWMVEPLGSSKYHIDVMVKTTDEGSFRVTGFYGEPEVPQRRQSWDTLTNLSSVNSAPWLVCGDFNEIVHDGEKCGGNPRDVQQMENFIDAIDSCNLNDLGYNGMWFTWSNKRAAAELVRERLDRMLATSEWYSLFPYAVVEHKAWTESDHCPLILTTEEQPRRRRKGPRRFYFEPSWAKNPDCKKLVWKTWQDPSGGSFNQKLRKVAGQLQQWHAVNIGELSRKILHIQEQLEILKTCPPTDAGLQEEKFLEAQLSKAIEEEALYWSTRSRELWLKDGDKNTAYHHASASERRKRNQIRKLKNDIGEWVEGQENLQAVAVNYFVELFKAGTTHRREEILQHVSKTITEEMNQFLTQEFTREEVHNALFQMHPSKAPGPDGLSALFYQQYWDVMGTDLTNTVLNLLNGKIEMKDFNENNLVLIPKMDHPDNMTQFRPISLCNVSYKVASKVLVNRFKTVLPYCISENQSVFVKGRQIVDNVMVAYEMMHELNGRKGGNKKHFALKLDMSKAYDRVEWVFLREMMTAMGFDDKWVQIIMRCISTVSFSVLINGENSSTFTPSRGLRQGDPLSPFLFVICAEGFSALLNHHRRTSYDLGMETGIDSPTVSHLFFADDSILFGKATLQSATKIIEILQLYEAGSGQKVNYDKSGLFFSRNIETHLQQQIQGLFGIDSVTNFFKYLGLPTLVGKDKRRAFKVIVDRIRAKIRSWSKRFLSIGGERYLSKLSYKLFPCIQCNVSCYPSHCAMTSTK